MDCSWNNFSHDYSYLCFQPIFRFLSQRKTYSSLLKPSNRSNRPNWLSVRKQKYLTCRDKRLDLPNLILAVSSDHVCKRCSSTLSHWWDWVLQVLEEVIQKQWCRVASRFGKNFDEISRCNTCHVSHGPWVIFEANLCINLTVKVHL